MKNCFASRNIVVHRVKLFCITEYCCAPCKIVLYDEKSLCIQLNILNCVLPLWATVHLHTNDTEISSSCFHIQHESSEESIKTGNKKREEVK